MTAEIETQVRSLIEDNFLFREDRSSLSDTESLIDAGLIDSMGILELVAFLEERFKIEIADTDRWHHPRPQPSTATRRCSASAVVALSCTIATRM